MSRCYEKILSLTNGRSSKSPPKNSLSVNTEIPAALLLYDLTTGFTSNSLFLNHPLLGLFLLNSAMIPVLPGSNKFCTSERLLICQKKPFFSNRSMLLIGLSFSISFLFVATIFSKISIRRFIYRPAGAYQNFILFLPICRPYGACKEINLRNDSFAFPLSKLSIAPLYASS